MAIPLLAPLGGPEVSGVGKVQLTDGSGLNTHIAVFNSAGTLVDGGPVPGGGGGTGSVVSYDGGDSTTPASAYVLRVNMGASI